MPELASEAMPGVFALLGWSPTRQVHRVIEVRGKGIGDLVRGSAIRPTESGLDSGLDLAEKSAGEPSELALALEEARM